MILSNRSIRQCLADGRFLLRIPPGIPGPDLADSSSSIDLRLDRLLQVPGSRALVLDPRQRSMLRQTLDSISTRMEIPESGYVLSPNSFVLGQTIEAVAFPLLKDHRPLAARVEGRSSFARCGLLVHFTAPTIHANFSGNIALEMINLGPNPILLTPMLPICQLILEEVDSLPLDDTEASMFQHQTSPAGL